MHAHPLRFGVLLLMAGILLTVAPKSVYGQGGPIAPGGPDLQTTLEKGLKARRPVEFQFIANVVQQVDNGTLPEATVISCFLWARRYRQYPCAYFMYALRNQAAQIGLAL